jgi:flagellar biosynthesis protein FlhA
MAAAVAGGGYLLRRGGQQQASAVLEPEPAPADGPEPENVLSLLKIDPIEIEIGYALIPITDAHQGGTLLGRVTLIRRQMALDLGIVVPTIRIRDNAQLPPNQYSIKLRGAQVATGEVRANRLMAMNPGTAAEEMEGIPAVEPAFGLPAIWITPDQQQHAEMLGYTVVDPASVIITHLSEVIRAHAPSILSRQDVQTLLNHVKEDHPALVGELVPDLLALGDVQRVLQSLLRERVSVRDLVTILEAIADQARLTRDADTLAEHARQALARQITAQYAEEDGRLPVLALAPALQQDLVRNLLQTERGAALHLDPVAGQRLLQSLRNGMERVAAAGHQPVLLVPARLRLAVRRFVEAGLPTLVVLSYAEVALGTEVVTLQAVEEAA